MQWIVIKNTWIQTASNFQRNSENKQKKPLTETFEIMETETSWTKFNIKCSKKFHIILLQKHFLNPGTYIMLITSFALWYYDIKLLLCN